MFTRGVFKVSKRCLGARGAVARFRSFDVGSHNVVSSVDLQSRESVSVFTENEKVSRRPHIPVMADEVVSLFDPKPGRY